MSEKDAKNYQLLLEQYTLLLNDVAAAKLCADLWLTAQIFDDIYDEQITKKDCLKLMKLVFVDIPQNPVYDAVRLKLQPLLHSMMLQWQAANSIEENKSDLNKSYMLRAYFFQIPQYLAALIHGDEYANQLSDSFNALYGEKYEDYSKEFTCQTQ